MVSISIPRRLPVAILFASAILTESCNDGLLHPPAPAAARVLVTASMSRSAIRSGWLEAFNRANRLFVRFRSGDVVRLEQEMPFTPSATEAETIVRIQVPLQELTESMSAEVELRLGDRPLFRATATSTLSSGAPTRIELPFVPIVDAVACGSGLVQLASFGQTLQLSGAALFASGDTLREVPVVWSVPANSSVNVSETGTVTALRDGDAVATCSAEGVTATRPVRVLAVVSSIQVTPATATLVVGTSLTYAATLFDARGNVISTARPLTWSSTNTGVASVSAAGVAIGVVAGAARIDATSGGAVGSGTLTVIAPSTAVTISSTGVTGTGATLLGSVNPRGVSTQAWFEWGTNPVLTAPAVTPTQSVGSGTADLNVSTALTGLVTSTTYYFRVVASSAAGTVRGATLSFRTPTPPTDSTNTVVTQPYSVTGTATPNGSATIAWFEYGTSPTFSTSSRTAQQAIGGGSTPVSLGAQLAVGQSTTYFVRIVASNAGGTTMGNVISFTTASQPSVTTPTGIAPTQYTNCSRAVAVSARANANGLSTLVWFEYGSSASLATYTETTRQTLGSGTAYLPISSTVYGSLVYFRAVAANQFGTTRSAIQSTFSGC
ncbi:MAG: hypothetical protein ABIP93_18970 [Gemmatimonadaceae bacterium]